MGIVLRSDKGSGLTVEEIDGNFVFLRDQIEALSGSVFAESIESVVVDSDGITFTGTEGTVWGPFGIPVALKPRGAWAAAKTYLVNDLIQKDSDLYVVAADHISGVFADDVAAGNLVLAYHGAASGGGGGGSGLPDPLPPVSGGRQHVLKYDDSISGVAWGWVSSEEVIASYFDAVAGGNVQTDLQTIIDKIGTKVGGL